jgi:uncharacterized protein (DUF697 family)/GTP-binding protein EngB required for normal cell division
MNGDDPFALLREKLDEEAAKLGTFNLAVIGATGAGKSTLINAVFRENIADVGNGRPVTQHVTKLTKEGVPLAIYDTKGVELGTAAEDVIEDFRKIIREKRLEGIHAQIHVIWYCIRAADKRIEDFQIRLIRELRKEDVPVVLVLTQCLTPESEDVVEFGKVISGLGLPVQPHGDPFLTLAQPHRISSEITLPAFGLGDLLNATFDLAPSAARKALVNAEKIDLELKTRQARKELAGFVASAFGVGFTPIPFSDAPALVVIQLSMLARIAIVFGVDTSKETLGSLVLAATGTGGMAAAGKYIATSLLRFVPGGNVGAGAIRAGVASTLTTALGEAYIAACREIVKAESAGHTPMAPDEIKDFVIQYYKDWLRKNAKRSTRSTP